MGSSRAKVVLLWRSEPVGRVAGALTREHYTQLLTVAGLADVEIIATHRVHEHATSAIIHARKPGNID